MWRRTLVLIAASVCLWAQQDPDRPVLKRKTPAQPPAESEPDQPKQDPDRPVLKRKTPAQEETKKEPDRPVLKRKDAPADAEPSKKEESKPEPEEPDYNRTVRGVPVRPDNADPGAPKLKRGGPATDRQAAREPEPDPVPPSARTAKPVLEIESDADGRVLRRNANLAGANDPLIDEAADTAFAFTENLPNFICNQMTWRSQSETRKPNWQVMDRVETELIILDGKEQYRNTKVSGKPVKDPRDVEKGQWSMGEFGSWLADLYNPATAAKFKFRRDSEAAGLRAKVYDFEVEKRNSHWQVKVNRTVYPAYSGSVWIDPATKRTLRIEVQAKNLDADLNWDHLEMAIDYGWVLISGQKFLLPVHSENVSCMRGSFLCSRNEIEFKNYRKFGAESTLSQVESEVAYPQSDSKVSYPTVKKQ